MFACIYTIIVPARVTTHSVVYWLQEVNISCAIAINQYYLKVKLVCIVKRKRYSDMLKLRYRVGVVADASFYTTAVAVADFFMFYKKGLQNTKILMDV